MDNTSLIAIISVVVIVILLTAVVLGIQALSNKATDSIRNKITRSSEKKNPPKQENLADRYNKL